MNQNTGITSGYNEQYSNYLKDHIANVRKAYQWLLDKKILLNDTYRSTINMHDISKWLDSEYMPYTDYFYGDNKNNQVKDAFNYAWLHHIHENEHHWQHWVLINDEDGTQALEMPEEYIIEMICDWFAFSFKSGNLKELLNWYTQHKNNMMLHPKTRSKVEDILNKIKEKLDEELV